MKKPLVIQVLLGQFYRKMDSKLARPKLDSKPLSLKIIF